MRERVCVWFGTELSVLLEKCRGIACLVQPLCMIIVKINQVYSGGFDRFVFSLVVRMTFGSIWPRLCNMDVILQSEYQCLGHWRASNYSFAVVRLVGAATEMSSRRSHDPFRSASESSFEWPIHTNDLWKDGKYCLTFLKTSGRESYLGSVAAKRRLGISSGDAVL
jgi:hypothetical protein